MGWGFFLFLFLHTAGIFPAVAGYYAPCIIYPKEHGMGHHTLKNMIQDITNQGTCDRTLHTKNMTGLYTLQKNMTYSDTGIYTPQNRAQDIQYTMMPDRAQTKGLSGTCIKYLYNEIQLKKKSDSDVYVQTAPVQFKIF